MLRKQKISSLVYGGLLIPIFLISFFLSGLFRYSGVTVLNFGSYLNQMFADNFIFPWRYYNAKTPVCLGMGLLVWIFLVSYLQFHYRNFQTGKEYGVEDWADPVEVTRRRSEKEPRKNRILSQNLQVAKEGVKAPPNNNMLVMGSAGTYKTTSIVTQNILQASDNYIVLDVKGELMYKYGLYLQSKGYTIRCLNLKDQSTSDRYNPFAYIEKEEDVINWLLIFMMLLHLLNPLQVILSGRMALCFISNLSSFMCGSMRSIRMSIKSQERSLKSEP